MQHRRLHSNTVSGDRPLAIDTTARPTLPRRNSEGSPGLPPEIDISAATPLESKQENGYLSLQDFPPNGNHTTVAALKQHVQNKDGIISKSSSSQSLPAPVPPLEVSNNHTLRIPKTAKKTRSRSSSQSSTVSARLRPGLSSIGVSGLRSRKTSESDNNNSRNNGTPAASVNLTPSRRGSDDTEDSVSEGERSMAAGSIATAVRTESVSDKRNQEFHALFRSVPEDDVLIEDYGCALQKEILVQGRIYISENYLCFNANIFGWVTNLVIAFADIVDIEKRTTAIFIPNAIQVSTLHAKHFFASFLSRDQAYDLMVNVWRYSRPLSNRSTDTSPDETLNSQLSNNESDSEMDEEDTSDLDSDGTYSDTETEDSLASPAIPLPSTLPKNMAKHDSLRRRAFSEGTKRLDDANIKDNVKSATPLLNRTNASSQALDIIQPADNTQITPPSKQVNEKTKCVCGELGEHYPNVVMDQTYSGNLEAFSNLLLTSDFMKRFLIDNEKSLDVDIGDWCQSEDTKKQVRKASYIKQLGGAIGPKQTQCLQTEEVIHSDMNKCVTVLTTTQTPDVPSGNSFSVKTRTCLTWAGHGKVHMLVTVLVEFTKSSWLKSTIERASVDGQITFYKHLDAAILNYQKESPSEFALEGESTNNKKKKGKRRHRKQRKDRGTKLKKEEPISDKMGYRSWMEVLTDRIKKVWTMGTTATENGFLTTSQLTFTCLILMIFANIYIAFKMKDVESRLNDAVYTDSHLKDDGGHWSFFSASPDESRYDVDDDAMEKVYRDELWDWLKTLDTEQEDRTTNATAPPNINTSKDTKQQHRQEEHRRDIGGDTSDYIDLSQQRTKTMLDQDLLALAKMIRRAERNIGQVSRAMEKQRNRISHP